TVRWRGSSTRWAGRFRRRGTASSTTDWSSRSRRSAASASRRSCCVRSARRPPARARRGSAMRSWSFSPKRTFVTGLLVTLPGLVAAYVLWIAFSHLDGILEPVLLRTLHRHLPGVGLFALVSLVFVVGLVASNILGARLLRAISSWLEHIPVFSPLYRAMRDISQVFLGDKASAFRQVGLIEWPRPGMYALVLVMAESTGFATRALGRDMVTVFLPTTPNPTTGFVQLVARDAVIPLDMPVEQALKLLISGGAAAGQWTNLAEAQAPSPL